MKTLIKESKHLMGMERGWGNGYVLIPPGHPVHGISYDDIDVDVHGGLTFAAAGEDLLDWGIDEEDSSAWIVGWDTAHYGDDIYLWPKERVQEETERLRDQLLAMEEQTLQGS